MDGSLDPQAARMGTRIRGLRRGRGLTLVQLAGLTGLSHSFLSQLERGRARPSMLSLERIAHALGTSQVALLAAAQDRPAEGESWSGPVHVVRSDQGARGPYADGEARLLVAGDRQIHPMEFSGTNTDPGAYYTHDDDEFVYVVTGTVVLDLARHGSVCLSTGDCAYYVGGTDHRWSSADGFSYRLLAVKPGASPAGSSPGGLS